MKNKFVFILITCIITLCIVTGCNDSKNNNSTKESTGKVEYAGFEITLLDGYKAKEKDKKLTISNNKYEYTVTVDFNFSYNEYIKDLELKYPDSAEACKATLDGKDYCAGMGAEAMSYYTAADDTSTFIGTAKKHDGDYSKEDVKDILTMLNNAKVKEKDTSYDVGGKELVW